MFRSALTIAAFLTALPAFAGSVPVVPSTSVVNPPVAALPPVAGITSPAPGVSGQILGQAALDLIGPTGGGAGAGTAPPDTVRLGGPVSPEQRRLIDRLLSQIEASVGEGAGLIRPSLSTHRSSF